MESLAYTLEWLPGDRAIQVMLARDFTKASTGITADACVRFGHALLAGLDVDAGGRVRRCGEGVGPAVEGAVSERRHVLDP